MWVIVWAVLDDVHKYSEYELIFETLLLQIEDGLAALGFWATAFVPQRHEQCLKP